MSKGYSGMFRGTKGDRVAEGINPNIQKEKAFSYAEEISKKGTSDEKFFLNTVTIVYDEANDKYYYGMNHGIELHKSKKSVILFGDKTHEGILPKVKLNRYPLGNCAEVDAINNALNAGAKLENLHMSTLDVSRKNIRSHSIIEKCACKNCVATFKGKIKKNNTGWEN